MAGLYPDPIIVERFLGSVTAQTLTQRFVAPTDLTIVGLVAYVSTAPGSGNGVTINISSVYTSQVTSVPSGAANQSVPNPQTLWSTTNVPTILGTATSSTATVNTTTVVKNVPYALNYPLPGPSGTSGYTTAQATSQTTETPVTSPPVIYEYQLGALVAPDNTYTDLNGITQPCSYVHAGDVLSFVVAGGGTNSSVGSAANLEIALYLEKR